METGGGRSSGAKLPARWRRTPPWRLRPHRSMKEHDERLGTLERRRPEHYVRQGKRGMRRRTLEPRQRRLRRSKGPGTPGPQGCANPHDPHPRAESRRPRRQEPGGRSVTGRLRGSYAACMKRQAKCAAACRRLAGGDLGGFLRQNCRSVIQKGTPFRGFYTVRLELGSPCLARTFLTAAIS